MRAKKVTWLIYGLFFTSGFCSLLYEVVWTRLAMASFGVITPVVSVMISVFMAGLALGSWLGGRLVVRFSGQRFSPILIYACVEAVIALGAVAVPELFKFGSAHLLDLGATNSTRYLIRSALVLGFSILPWTIAMGATFPWMMLFIRGVTQRSERVFSALYLANCVGATFGCFFTAFFMIELLGFHKTLITAGLMNFAIALVSLWLAVNPRQKAIPEPTYADKALPPIRQSCKDGHGLYWILFITGFCSMGMEVVWTRAFTPILGTTVYAFATVLIVYLLATCLGSILYRTNLDKNCPIALIELLFWTAGACALPLFSSDPRLSLGIPGVIFGIFPFCAVLGYLTPLLIDSQGGGDPKETGAAYAINIVGCILGPLAASYFLLPLLDERHALLILSVPFWVTAGVYARAALKKDIRLKVSGFVACFCILLALFASQSVTERIADPKVVRRDHVATVISFGERMGRKLLVNGVGMTHLTPITKLMVHLPLLLVEHKLESALIICFGMGTSFRSALSWGLKTTAVELVPSVARAFDYYHADAAAILANPNASVVIDDGRRFLRRTTEHYDLIVIDPPPPLEAAGSSLLYSRQFYEEAQRHLTIGGILQQWFPGGSSDTLRAVLRAITAVFPHVRMFQSVEGWGYHILASETPINIPSAETLLLRMPQKAQLDMMEWVVAKPLDLVRLFFAHEVRAREEPPSDITREITDDRPYNEYYRVRTWLNPGR